MSESVDTIFGLWVVVGASVAFKAWADFADNVIVDDSTCYLTIGDLLFLAGIAVRLESKTLASVIQEDDVLRGFFIY